MNKEKDAKKLILAFQLACEEGNLNSLKEIFPKFTDVDFPALVTSSLILFNNRNHAFHFIQL